MPIQVYVDESGGPGAPGHFVVAGLVGHSIDWANFADEWKLALDESPAIARFKMKEAAALNGPFHGFTEDQRDRKLRRLARIINSYAQIITYSVIDIGAHALTWANLPKPMGELYFWPFHTTILASGFTLWDAGWRERFEIIFDKQVIFGPRARHYYPLVKALCKIRQPGLATILPTDPMFKNDDEFLPLQAADMFAWCIRKATNDPSYASFNWLLDEMRNVKTTDYSQYYDFERLGDVLKQMVKMLKDGSIPAEFVETCGVLPRLKSGRR